MFREVPARTKPHAFCGDTNGIQRETFLGNSTGVQKVPAGQSQSGPNEQLLYEKKIETTPSGIDLIVTASSASQVVRTTGVSGVSGVSRHQGLTTAAVSDQSQVCRYTKKMRMLRMHKEAPGFRRGPNDGET